MCGGHVLNILSLPLVARCIETIDVCTWRWFIFVSVVVTVWGVYENVCCTAAIVEDSEL